MCALTITRTRLYEEVVALEAHSVSCHCCTYEFGCILCTIELTREMQDSWLSSFLLTSINVQLGFLNTRAASCSGFQYHPFATRSSTTSCVTPG